MNRRRAATVIRLRQELQKRVQRSSHVWQNGSSLREFLVDSLANLCVSGSDHRLTDALRNSQARPLFLPNVSHSGEQQPPDNAAIMREGEDLLAGHWRVFDSPVELGSGFPRWRANPLGGPDVSCQHFASIRYFDLGTDLKFIWELNRHSELLRLAQCYYLSGDERFAGRCTELLANWMEDNPPNFSINWVSALEVAFRSIAWCWIWRLTSRSVSWTPSLVARLLWTLGHAGRHLYDYDSIHHSPNTHLTGEALGLLYIGLTFPDFRASSKWKRRGIEILTSELPHQFLDDGFHFERSTGYHRYNLEFYLHALALARAADETWGEPLVPHLQRALAVSVALRKPAGDWPVIGDEDGGSAVRLWSSPSTNQAPLLALGAALLQDGRLLTNVDDCDRGLPWWMGLELPVERIAEQLSSVSMPQAGYFVALDDTTQDQWYCVVDAGPHGGGKTGHAHTDVGHVELVAGKDLILCDPGCAVYASDPVKREWYRSLRAHSCLSIDDDPLAITRGPFGWSQVAPTPFAIAEEHHDYWTCRLRYSLVNRTVTHERQVMLLRGWGLIVVDFVLGEGEHELRWHWPLAVPIEVLAPALSGASVALGKTVMTWSPRDKLVASIHQSARSPSYGIELPSSRLELALTTSLPTTMLYSFRRLSVRPGEVEHTGSEVTFLHPDKRHIVFRPGESSLHSHRLI